MAAFARAFFLRLCTISLRVNLSLEMAIVIEKHSRKIAVAIILSILGVVESL